MTAARTPTASARNGCARTQDHTSKPSRLKTVATVAATLCHTACCSLLFMLPYASCHPAALLPQTQTQTGSDFPRGPPPWQSAPALPRTPRLPTRRPKTQTTR
eukprot:10253596-Alexandrium_andersonii.AAC.1